MANTETPRRLCKQVGFVAKRVSSSLSTSALRICLICTDGSVYLVTSSRNTPHHTISQPDKTLQSIHNLSQLIYHKTGKIRNLRLSRQRLRSLVCYDVTPCSLAEMLPHPKAYSSIVKPAAYSTYRLVSVDTQRLSIYVFNPLNTKRDEKGLGDAARGTGGGGNHRPRPSNFTLCCLFPTVHFLSSYLLHFPANCFKPTFTRRTSGHGLVPSQH